MGTGRRSLEHDWQRRCLIDGTEWCSSLPSDRHAVSNSPCFNHVVLIDRVLSQGADTDTGHKPDRDPASKPYPLSKPRPKPRP